LSAAAEDKLRTVVKAMNERPQLKIAVPIATVAELDRPALVEVQFQAAVRDALASRSKRKKGATAPPSFDQLDPAAQVDVLTQVYQQKLGTEPKFPDAIGSLKAKPEIIAAKADFLTRELHAHLAISDADLEALGQQRAATLQQALLGNDTQIDPARVFLVANDKAKPDDAKVRLELSLQ
jgi:multidrug efflux pump subunit AcrB